MIKRSSLNIVRFHHTRTRLMHNFEPSKRPGIKEDYAEGEIVCPQYDEHSIASRIPNQPSNSMRRVCHDEDNIDRFLFRSMGANKRYKNDAEDDEYGFGSKAKMPNPNQPPARGAARRHFVEDKCNLCLGSDGFRKYHQKNLVSASPSVYALLEDYKPLVAYQMIIAPLDHTGSMMQADETVQEESRNYLKSITMFYASMGKLPVFVETADHANSSRKHTRIQAYPIPESRFEHAKSFFIKALRELADESLSDTKSIIHCKGRSNVKSSGIAVRADYIHVDLALQAGMVHVISHDYDQSLSKFARRTISGILGLDDLTVGEVIPINDVKVAFKQSDWTA